MHHRRLFHRVGPGRRVWPTTAALTAAACLSLAAAGQAATRISFWSTYSETENNVFVQQVVPLFEKQNPDIEVEVVRLGYDELRDKLVATAATGGGPDVARVDIIWTPSMAAAGLLEPLDAYAGFRNYQSIVFPGPLQTNAYRGRHYGLPLDTNTQIYIYNADLFDEAGLAAPNTFAEFEQVTTKLTRRQGQSTVYGYDIGGPWAWFILPWIWSNGGDLTDAELTRASGFLDGDRSVEAVTRIAQWAGAGILAPNIRGEGWDSWGSFVNKQVAARQDGPWFPRWLEETQKGFRAGFALMPAGAGQKSASVIGGENVVILQGSKNKQAAWRFVQFLLSREAQIIMAGAGQMPVIRAAVGSPEFQKNRFYPVYLQQLLTARPRTPHPRWPDIQRILEEALQPVMKGQQSPRSALAEAARRIDQVLAPAR